MQNLHRHEILKLSSKLLHVNKVRNGIKSFMNKEDVDKLDSSRTCSQKLSSRQNALTTQNAFVVAVYP